MTIQNPAHPGEFIEKTYLEESRLSRRIVAELLNVSPSTFNRLILGESDISPEMAIRLSNTLGRSPESWLALQAQYDIWIAKKGINSKYGNFYMTSLLIEKDSALEKLQNQIHKIEMLLETRRPRNASELANLTDKYEEWHKITRLSLEKIIDNEQEIDGFKKTNIHNLNLIKYSTFGPDVDTQKRAHFADDIKNLYEVRMSKGKSFLTCLVTAINEGVIEEKINKHVVKNTNISMELAGKVFIIHGHDDHLKTSVARLIENIGLEPIILHEQPNMGRTIIEKFTDYAKETCFAIALLTPDDIGQSVKSNSPNPRARQNVILELGYFSALLGLNRVCSLYSPVIELPSDINGLLYIPYMDGDCKWKYAIAEEMKAAGLDVDFNRIK